MPDLVVTVPRKLWAEWIEEGDAVGEPTSGVEWGFFLGSNRPPINPGERLYIVAHDRLRGFAPVTRVAFFVDACPEHSFLAAALGEKLGGRGAVTCSWCRARLDEGDFGCAQRPPGATGRWAIGRKGAAVATTIPEQVRGFRGWRRRWWSRELEQPFPDWATADLWLDKARAKARREAKASATATSSPTTQKELF